MVDSQIMSLRASEKPQPPMLVVGDLDGWRSRGRELPEAEGLHFVGFSGLDEARLAEIGPEIVLSSLVGPEFDVIDLARKLEALGFSGRYRVLATGVPAPDLVRQEVKQHAPNLDFDILVIAEED